MPKRLNVGAIGWLMYYDDEIAKTTAICDINEAKVRNGVAAHPGTQGYTDYRKMVDEAGLDVVIISTPNWLHTEMAERFMRKGVDVFLEKPMGVNKAECDRLLKAQKSTGKTCAIDFEMRTGTAMGRIRDVIGAGEIGDLVGIEFVHHRGAWEARGNGVWRTQPEKSGGLFFMEICHEVDTLRLLAGDIQAVQSFKMKNVLPQYPDNMPDNVCTHLWFEGGVTATILAGHTISVCDAPLGLYDDLGHDMRWGIVGTEGALRYDEIRQKLLVVRYAEFHPDAPVGKHVEFKRVEDYSSVKNMNHDIAGNQRRFLQTIHEGKDWHQPLEDAWRTHVVCLAAERSAITDNQRIKVDYALS